MTQLFLFAGVPHALHDAFYPKIEGNLLKGRKDCQFVYAPLPQGVWTYTPEYIALLYKKAYRSIVNLIGPQRSYSPPNISITLFYLEYDKDSEKRLLDKFFPYVISKACGQVEDSHLFNKGGARRAAVNKIERQFRSSIGLAAGIIETLKIELTSNDNRTPLLLPLRNFQSKVLATDLTHFSMVEHYDLTNPKADLRARINKMLPRLGFRSYEKDNKKYFHDGRGITFKSPGKDRHGLAALQVILEEKNHNSQCVLGAFVRLGVPFDPQFHYDCVTGKKLPKKWTGCHEEERLADKQRSHMNVAPNDYIR